MATCGCKIVPLTGPNNSHTYPSSWPSARSGAQFGLLLRRRHLTKAAAAGGGSLSISCRPPLPQQEQQRRPLERKARSPFFAASSKKRTLASSSFGPPRAAAAESNGSYGGGGGADEFDQSTSSSSSSSLSSDNAVSLFDFASLQVVGSPSQGDAAASPIVAGAAGNNRAGLYRTPISGGVQSATSSHGLPHPAVAVRNLIEQARYAHLCTIMSRMHHRRWGYPFGSLVEFSTDLTGHPIFSLSPLAIHTRNLLADPRCTLVVQVPGWSGLANARVTIFGDVYPLAREEQEWAHQRYTLKHQHGTSQQWGNFNYYRMDVISDVYFVGGFGTVAWVDVNEYENALPDVIAANGSEQTLQELNSRFSKPLREVLSIHSEVDDAALISIDSKGVDVRVRQGAQFNVQRLPFQEDNGVETLDHAISALQKVLDGASSTGCPPPGRGKP